MGVFDEMRVAQEREKERESLFAKVIASFDTMPREDQILLLAKLANRLDASNGVSTNASTNGTPDVVPTPVSAELEPPTRREHALSLLRLSPRGASSATVAAAVYGAGPNGNPMRADVGKARAVLNDLRQSGLAYSDAEGTWFAGSPPEAAPAALHESSDETRATPLVRRVVAQAAEPLMMAEIVHRVRALHPDADKRFIYSAVYKMTKAGRFAKLDDGRYSLVREYRPGFRKEAPAK